MILYYIYIFIFSLRNILNDNGVKIKLIDCSWYVIKDEVCSISSDSSFECDRLFEENTNTDIIELEPVDECW